MKVVVRSSSLAFTLLSIILNVPISRVKQKPEGSDSNGVASDEHPRTSQNGHGIVADHAYRLHTRPPG